MHTGEGSTVDGEDRDDRNDGSDNRPDRIGVGGGDDAVTRIQLAARWSESYAPEQGDSLSAALKRFRAAYEYVDSVTHGVEPALPAEDLGNSHAAPAPPPVQSAPSPPPPPPQSEPRPW